LSKAQAELERAILETEWKECRETIRNFDRNLTSLRVYSLVVTVALMGVSADFFAKGRIEAALTVASVAVALVFVVLFLERHYRGYLLIAVERAIALERRLRSVYKRQPMQTDLDLDDLSISIDCKKKTKAMITEVIKERHDSYNFFWKHAHALVFVVLLFLGLALLIIFGLVFLKIL
jgi:hypothetical protein